MFLAFVPSRTLFMFLTKRGEYMKRRKRHSSKKICQTIHFQKRSLQRFGVVLGKAERKAIIDDIQGSNYFCIFIERQSNTRSKYLVKLDGVKPMIVIYDKTRKNLVTVLNPYI